MRGTPIEDKWLEDKSFCSVGCSSSSIQFILDRNNSIAAVLSRFVYSHSLGLQHASSNGKRMNIVGSLSEP